jgi:hypothetical protein
MSMNSTWSALAVLNRLHIVEVHPIANWWIYHLDDYLYELQGKE